MLFLNKKKYYIYNTVIKMSSIDYCMAANEVVYTRPSVIVERKPIDENLYKNTNWLCDFKRPIIQPMTKYLEVDKFALSHTHFECIVEGGITNVIQKIRNICGQMQLQIKPTTWNPFRFDAMIFYPNSPYICKFTIEVLQFEYSEEKSFVIDMSVKSNGTLGFANIFNEFKERFINGIYVQNEPVQQNTFPMIKTIKSNNDWIDLVKALDELPITWSYYSSVNVIYKNSPAPPFVIRKIISKATTHPFALGLAHILELTESSYSFNDDNLLIEGISVYEWIDIVIKVIEGKDDISLNVGIKLLIKIASKSDVVKKIIHEMFSNYPRIMDIISQMKKSDWNENHELARIFETIIEN